MNLRLALSALLLATPLASLAQSWDVSSLYRNGMSARELIDTEVRGANAAAIGDVKDIIVGGDGRISRLVVEVGGFFEMGDQHIGVPWKDVKIGQNMAFVQVPLQEVERGTYSLFGAVPQGEDVAAPQSAWRVNELIGDYASLQDVPRYGLVTDVIFDDRARVKGVIVDRARGTWGDRGWYAYPFAGWHRDSHAYALPYRSSDVQRFQRFDYVQLGELSPYSRGGASAGATRDKGSR